MTGHFRWMPLDGLLIAAAIAAAVAAANTEPLSSPIAPEGGWRTVWIAAVAVSFAAYATAVAYRRNRPPHLAPILVIAAAVQLAPLAGPLLLSADAYTYWDYARIAAVHDANPYSDPPTSFPHDPYVTALGDGLGPITSIYGPAFTLASEGHAHLTGDSPRAAELLYRAAAAAAVLLLTLLAAKIAPRPQLAAIIIGWNPLLALHFAGGGHNDVWMLVPALGAILLAQRRHHALAGASWAVAATVKATAVALLPLELVAHARGDPRRAATMLAGLAAAAAVLALAFTARYGTHWLSSFERAWGQTRQTSSISSRFLLEHRLNVPPRAAGMVLLAVFVTSYALLLREAWRGRPRLGLAAGTLILTTGWLMPWYGAWAVSLSAVAEDKLAQALAVALTGYLLWDALPLQRI